MDSQLPVYLGLFFSAFISATVLPAQSELVLAGLLFAEKHPVWTLIIVACAGNSLGAALNWLLGRYSQRFQDRRWFPVKAETLRKTETWYRKYGRWTLLMSWVPVIGDPLTVVAGVLREPFVSFIVIVAFAKMFRYLVVAGLTLHWVG
ncbi:MAG: YqaA family protein [Humidesulfovibrio sp.]|uniref:YqaA family protein n=1 Tax=Humidesulfovibrio sp. TaxID=2910988 RepID=UPI00273280A0|nr:YqaA family protein [Humidesulfovibrio sp.]MDP2848858.1 YqaA family protein [Humidesulfovibrio sp.]